MSPTFRPQGTASEIGSTLRRNMLVEPQELARGPRRARGRALSPARRSTPRARSARPCSRASRRNPLRPPKFTCADSQVGTVHLVVAARVDQQRGARVERLRGVRGRGRHRAVLAQGAEPGHRDSTRLWASWWKRALHPEVGAEGEREHAGVHGHVPARVVAHQQHRALLGNVLEARARRRGSRGSRASRARAGSRGCSRGRARRGRPPARRCWAARATPRWRARRCRTPQPAAAAHGSGRRRGRPCHVPAESRCRWRCPDARRDRTVRADAAGCPGGAGCATRQAAPAGSREPARWTAARRAGRACAARPGAGPRGACARPASASCSATRPLRGRDHLLAALRAHEVAAHRAQVVRRRLDQHNLGAVARAPCAPRCPSRRPFAARLSWPGPVERVDRARVVASEESGFRQITRSRPRPGEQVEVRGRAHAAVHVTAAPILTGR